MAITRVKKHVRKRKNGASVVKSHDRMISRTHRIHNGKRQVFVDGFWKHDDYPFAPKESWTVEHLLRERKSLQTDLSEGLAGAQTLPHRKYGLLTRRIRKIDRILKKKMTEK